MIGHMLTMYYMLDRQDDWKKHETSVMVTADSWSYDSGRSIEFMAVGLPDSFCFAVAEQRNTTPDSTVRTGDCRQGSWAGMATKIGMNKYQGIQSTGLSNQASGLTGLSNATRLPFKANTEDSKVARYTLGDMIDYGLVRSYASGGARHELTQSVHLPYYSRDLHDDPPVSLYPANYGSTLDGQTRTVRGTPSEVRTQVLERTGGTATTCFASYGDNVIGGLTWLSEGLNVIGTTPVETVEKASVPYTANQLGEVKSGTQGQAAWNRVFIAGGTTEAPYKIHYLVLTVNSDGTRSFASKASETPPTFGNTYAPEAYTMFTDDKSATADNAENRNVLIQAYYASKQKESSYTIKYPISVPVAFTRPIDRNGNNVNGVNKWTTEADFIEHTYTIGGQ